MKATILCPGPSLAGEFNGDLIIGINRSVLSHKCDVWAANDESTIRSNSPTGKPLLLTKRDTVVAAPERFLSVLYTDDLDGPSFRWNLKTMICAMVFALRVGNATNIDIFGFDAIGTKDYDGREAGQDRSEKRWLDELEIYRMTVGWLGGQGCTVTRH